MDKKNFGFIKIYSILNLGEDAAKVIGSGYASNSAKEKLVATCNITMLDILDESKLFFIKDIITRPKIQRLKISKKLLDTFIEWYGNKNR